MIEIQKTGKKHYLVLLAAFTLFCIGGCSGDSGKLKIVQKALPYAENALEPYISAKTMNLHYGKHHAGYVEKANILLDDSDLNGKTLEEIIRLSEKDKKKYSNLFNNAAQAWNHEFFWESMKHKGGGGPYGNVANQIKKTFGSYDKFKNEFIKAAGQLFGSGWVWLIQESGTLKILTTGNADNPLAHGQVPLFTVDVWEHSYYLDYQNKRGEYVKLVIENLLDWDRVEARMEEK